MKVLLQNASGLTVASCGLHGFSETLGIDVDELCVYWKLDTVHEHEKQVAYRIVVSTTKLHGNEDEDVVGDCYDSGRIESTAQRNIVVKPANGFRPTTLHCWIVQVWNQDGAMVTSAVNEFYTSYPRSNKLLPPYSMNQTYMPHSSLIFRTWFEDEDERWKAVWIGDGGDKPIYLRKAIPLQRRPSRVIVFASGLGHFNLSVNGQPASPHVLDPGWTNYHRTVQFVAYDVTQHVLAFTSEEGGESVIGAHVGNGFYAGDQGDRFFWPMYEDNTYVRYGNELCFFAEIHVHYDDGTHECVISDPSWSVRKSATTLANIYASENHDATSYPTGWDTSSFYTSADSIAWGPAKPLTGPRGKLRYQSQPPVVLHNTFTPVIQKAVSPGVLMFDLGQNSSIVPRVVASGKKGQEYRIKYAETLGPDGFVFMPDPLFKQFETHVYSKVTLLGVGQEVWTPDFSFTSARYIQIEGARLQDDLEQDLPVIHSVTARHISSAAAHLGSITTDKDDVNALINACYWTFSSNLFSYHTDCPQIEKFGWLEVTSLLFPATQYVRDMEDMYTKILDDIIEAQEPSGLVPTMAPLVRYMCGPMHDTITWGAAICLLPEMIKKYYGSTATFEKCWVPCVRYMEYMLTRERDGGLIEHGLGDWGRDIAYGNHQANIETAVYYKSLRNVAMMAQELGKVEEEARFTAWADRIYAVYNMHLLVVDRTDQPYAYYTSRDTPGQHDRTMVAQAMALQFGLVPPELKKDVETAFVAAAEDSGHVMLAGEIGLKYLWSTLADPGVDRPDIVMNMARQEEHPSYMRFLRRGETSLLEFWQDACRSKCHDMLGTIYEWFYAYALGVQPLEDAYRVWQLRSAFKAEFEYVAGEVNSPYGLIRVVFDRCGRADGSAVVIVRVPTSTTCHLVLPSNTSTVSVQRLPGKEIRVHNGSLVQLFQGEYTLTVFP